MYVQKKLIIFLLLSLLLLGCKNTSPKQNDTTPTQAKVSYHSYYRDEIVNQNTINNTPFMAIVENSDDARPQCGLSSADVLYETYAEGGIPRFIALFQQEYPNKIGPIRSARPYFIDIAEEYNIPFAHCGGSEDALNKIASSNSIMSMNEINYGSYFWRDSARVAPHNLYTSSENILKFIKDKNWNFDYNKPLTFNDEYYSNSNLQNVSSVNIVFNKYYNTKYTFENNLFTKYMNDNIAVDANNNKPLSFTNVVIQKTNIDITDAVNHLSIDLVGTGDGYILSRGKCITVKWTRASNTSKTIFYDQNGNQVPLSSGKTMWSIVSNSTEIRID